MCKYLHGRAKVDYERVEGDDCSDHKPRASRPVVGVLFVVRSIPVPESLISEILQTGSKSMAYQPTRISPSLVLRGAMGIDFVLVRLGRTPSSSCVVAGVLPLTGFWR